MMILREGKPVGILRQDGSIESQLLVLQELNAFLAGEWHLYLCALLTNLNLRVPMRCLLMVP